MTGETTPSNPTELAVAIGRLEEGQKYLLEGFREMKDELRKDVTAIRVQLDENTKDIAELKAARAPKVSPWTRASVILGVPASLGALIAVVVLIVNQ